MPVNHTTLRDLVNNDVRTAVHGTHMLLHGTIDLFVFVLILIISYSIIFLILEGLRKFVKKRKYPRNVQSWLVFVANVILVTAALIIALSYLGIGLHYILGLGFIAFIISPGAQTPSDNAFQGLIILMTNEYQVGQVIKINDTIGLIVGINLMRVQLQLPSGNLTNIPTGVFGRSQVTFLDKHAMQETKKSTIPPKTNAKLHIEDRVVQSLQEDAIMTGAK